MTYMDESVNSFGLRSKEPEKLKDGVFVLGLQGLGEHHTIY